ncbi:MAG: hypothetical protein RJQ21_09195 [Rhodospirillales bacterium]
MNDNAVFSIRTLAALMTVGILSFTGIVVISMVAPDVQRESDFDASTYSVSAVGHKALVETLRASGRTVLVSRSRSAEKAAADNLLLAVEPESAELLKNLVGSARSARSTLIVLPKRLVGRHEANARWVGTHRLVAVERIAGIAEPVVQNLRLTRGLAHRRIHGDFVLNPPEIDVDDLQLLQWNPGLQPLLQVGSGILLARVGNRFSRTFLLSDPDILNNSGLSRGENAQLTAMILDQIAGSNDAFVFDEEIHGFGQRPDLWRNLLSPPLVAPTLAVAMALLVLVLAGVKRFGPAMKARPAHAAGRGTLYDVTAMLLGQRGDYRLLAREYAAMTMRVMSEEMRLSRRLTTEQRVRHIAEIGRRRGVEGDLRGMLAGLGYFGAAVTGRRVEAVALAARLNQWSKEVLHGIR